MNALTERLKKHSECFVSHIVVFITDGFRLDTRIYRRAQTQRAEVFSQQPLRPASSHETTPETSAATHYAEHTFCMIFNADFGVYLPLF